MAAPPCPAACANRPPAAATAVAAAPVARMLRLIGSIAKRPRTASMTASPVSHLLARLVPALKSRGMAESGPAAAEKPLIQGLIARNRVGFCPQNLDFGRIEARSVSYTHL